MSILMTTASKNRAAKKKGHSSQNVSRVPYLEAGTQPSFSDQSTSVWYWILDGKPTTVAYNKKKKEVRCNGYVLDAYDGLIEGEDGCEEEDEDYDEGGVVDFAIFVAESQTSHEGRIVHLSPSASTGFRTHDLYVDGFLIPEHLPETKDPESVAFTSYARSVSDEGVYMSDGSRGMENTVEFEGEPTGYNFTMHGSGTNQPRPPW